MARYSIPVLQRALAAKGHRWLDDGRPHLPNIIGIRRPGLPNRFDDVITLSVHNGREWKYFEWLATTDPGLYWLQNPMNVQGTAILVPGQYTDCWAIGLHQGKYEALVQRAPVTVWRDSDRNGRPDTGGKTDTGIFGINIHRANADRESVQVDRWSAGCQVIANPASFSHLMMQARDAAAARPGCRFTYTLLEEKNL